MKLRADKDAEQAIVKIALNAKTYKADPWQYEFALNYLCPFVGTFKVTFGTKSTGKEGWRWLLFWKKPVKVPHIFILVHLKKDKLHSVLTTFDTRQIKVAMDLLRPDGVGYTLLVP